jgi:Zn-dependent protease
VLSVVVPLAIVLVALSIHEAAHAWSADKLGDPTARLLGRVSLNPLVHIDVIGTVILPVLAAISGLPIIGWAKPVPVNISRLRNPRRDFMLVAAAGPASNLLQAFVAAMVFRVIAGGSDAGYNESAIHSLLVDAVQINVFLALFNLIPVPPLDGGNVLAGLLPPAAAHMFVRLREFGFIILYALMFTGILSALIVPPAISLIRLLLP